MPKPTPVVPWGESAGATRARPEARRGRGGRAREELRRVDVVLREARIVSDAAEAAEGKDRGPSAASASRCIGRGVSD
jgi:hypothetical protein